MKFSKNPRNLKINKIVDLYGILIFKVFTVEICIKNKKEIQNH